MPIADNDPRLKDPKFQEFDDMVCHVLDKRDKTRKDAEAAKLLEEQKNKPKSFFDFLPF